MSLSQRHIIQKQIIQLSIDEASRSFEIQNRISAIVNNGLKKKIDDYLNRISNENETIYFDKIEIDIGSIQPDKLENDFSKKLMQQFEKKLSALIPGISSKKIISTEQKAIDDFIFFLDHGYVSWNSSIENIEQLEIEISKCIDRLKFRLPLDIIHATRLAAQFSETFLKLFALNVLDSKREDLDRLKILFSGIYVKDFSNELTEKLFWKSVFTLDKITLEEKIAAQHLKEINSADLSFKPELLVSTEKKEERIYISNAGLVLLHPFIATLFNELKFTAENKFEDIFLQQKAAHLLQYLVTGKTMQDEFNFPLNKILCGLPINYPIEKEIPLTKQEMNEAEDVLNAVIKHWAALKNTSAEGLRNTFLLRNGVISKISTGWKLQVERTAFDVLLNRLPWGIGVIKLPWMQHILNVEWF